MGFLLAALVAISSAILGIPAGTLVCLCTGVGPMWSGRGWEGS